MQSSEDIGRALDAHLRHGIAGAMRDHGLARQVADAAGCSVGTVLNIASGKGSPRSDILDGIRSYLLHEDTQEVVDE